jgi:hypothetical protein
MKNKPPFAFMKSWLLLLPFLFPILSCSTVQDAIFPATATPTATPTPTRTLTPTLAPLAERDLQPIALQKSDLPDGFVEINFPDVEQILGQVSASIAKALRGNLETGFLNLFTRTRDNSVYANMILVYQDAGSAQRAFEDYADELTVGMTSYVVSWRYHEAVVELDYVGEDDIGIDELIRLAEMIQSRIESA